MPRVTNKSPIFTKRGYGAGILLNPTSIMSRNNRSIIKMITISLRIVLIYVLYHLHNITLSFVILHNFPGKNTLFPSIHQILALFYVNKCSVHIILNSHIIPATAADLSICSCCCLLSKTPDVYTPSLENLYLMPPDPFPCLEDF